MEGIYFVKAVGTPETITTQKGDQLTKLNIVLATKETRVGDTGCYAVDVEFAIDLLGDRANNFSLTIGTWLVANIAVNAREYNGKYSPEFRLIRYVKL